MADESARLVIQADADEITQAASEVERLRRAMEAARDAVLRSAPGWEMQARGLSDLATQLNKAETAYERVARAAQQAQRASGGGGPGSGGRMDPGRASMFGFNLANTLQDAAYNPAYAINNVMFMAQQSGGVKELGKDLKEFTVIAAAAAAGGIKSLPSLIAGAGAAAAAGGVALAGLGGVLLVTNRGLKDAGLGWSDLLDVMGETAPIKAASKSLSEAWDVVSSSAAGVAIDSAWDSTKGLVNEIANVTLGWDAATEAVKRHKEEAGRNAADAAQATRTSGNLRGDFQADIAGAESAAELATVTERLNKAFAAGRMTEEDYAATLERVNAAQDAMQKKQGEAALRAQAAETDLVAARLNAAQATREKAAAEAKAAEASRNAAEAAALEAEQKAKLRQFDQRVDRRADLYGSAFGGGVAQAMFNAAMRGEQSGEVDDRMRAQLAARMQHMDPGMRAATIEQIVQRSRMMAEDQAVVMGFNRDMMGAQLGAMGQGNGFLAVAARQQAARMGQAMGINVGAFRQAMGAADPTKEQMEGAKQFREAVDEFRDVIRNVEVKI